MKPSQRLPVVVSAPPLTGTQHQEVCNAVHFAYHHGGCTPAQACTALGLPWQGEGDVARYFVFYRGWAERVEVTPHAHTALQN